MHFITLKTLDPPFVLHLSKKKQKNQTLQTTKLKSRTPTYFIFPSRMHIFNLTWNATSDKSKSILYLHTYFAHSVIMISRVFLLVFLSIFSVGLFASWSVGLLACLSICLFVVGFLFLSWSDLYWNVASIHSNANFIRRKLSLVVLSTNSPLKFNKCWFDTKLLERGMFYY